MAKKMFVYVEEKVGFPTMLAAAEHVGKKRIYPKDFEKLGIKEMTPEEFEAFVAETTEEPAPEVNEPEVETPEFNEESPTEEAGLEKDDILGREHPNKEKEEAEKVAKAAKKAEKAAKKETEKTPEPKAEPEEKPEPEAAGKEPEAGELDFTDIEEFAQVMKGMSGEEVINLAKALELEWTENENKGINRMRASMALREHFFPGQRRPKGKKSLWKKVPYAELEKIAAEHSLTWTVTEDEKINRMWVIHELNKAGITPPVKEVETAAK